MFQSFTSRRFLLLAMLLLIVNTVVFLLITDTNSLTMEMGEEGLLENLQLVYLGLATLAFLIGGLRSRAEMRMFCIGMAVLMTIFFLREVELEPTNFLFRYIESHVFRLHETIIVVAIAATYILLRRSYVKPVVGFLFSKKSWPFYLAAVLVVLGEIFEKNHSNPYHEFNEELFECASYLLMLCLGIRSATFKPHQNDRKAL